MNESASDFAQGRLLKLEARSVGSRIWLGPGWALLCGAVASARLELSWYTLVSLLLGLLLVDPLWGTIWAVASAGPTALATSQGGNPGQKATPSVPPYSAPGSVGYRLFRYLSERASLWRSILSSRAGSPLLTLVFSSLVGLLVAALLGEGPLLLTVVALVVAALLFAISASRKGTRLALGSLFSAGLAWLIGYATFHSLAALSSDRSLIGEPLLWAAIYATAFHAYQLLGMGSLAKGATLLNLAQLASIALLVIVKQPIAAGIVGLLLLSQMLLQPSLLSASDGLWYLRRVQVFTMAAMMVTAVAAVI